MPHPPTVDAHCHFWLLSRGDYGWLEGTGGPLAPIRRDFGPCDYPAQRHVIAVQAAPTLAETDHLLALAAQHPFIAGVVGWVDLTDPASVGVIENRAANTALCGIRPMLQDIADTDWLLTASRPEVLAAVTRAGLCFDALVTPRHLPLLPQFIRQNPSLPVVIDHAAKPQPGDRSEWAKGMRALAAIPQVHCKLSGLLTELSPAELAHPFPALSDIVSQLIDWFGPDRLIWGSDWPVLTLAADYETWVDLTSQCLRGLSPTERAAILGANAARFYGLDLTGQAAGPAVIEGA